jgi:hypothetical protein
MMSEIAEFLRQAWASLPSPIAALLTLVVGWLAAIALRFVLSRLLGLVRFDRLSERAGFAEFLRKGGVQYSPSKLVGSIAYWLLLLVTLFRASKAMDVRIAEALTERAIELFPSIIAAGFIAILGAVLVSFLANFVMTIARNAGIPNARLISRAIRLVGDLVVLTVALEQVGLGRTVLSSMFQLLFGALVFGLALAFGLGSKDLAREAMQRFIRNLQERGRGPKGGDLEG